MHQQTPQVDVLYEEGPCLAVHKPAGVLTQAPPSIDSIEVRLKEFLKTRDRKTGNIYLGVPHRLDRPVSGVMLFARHVRACRRISEQFEARSIQKIYWACVSGNVQPPEGIWQDWLRKIPGKAQSEIVDEDHPDGRKAVLRYRTIGQSRFGSWLEVTLETGRTHQIRVQAAARRHAILGDELYGSSVAFGPVVQDPRSRAIALHGRSLTFTHPMTRVALSVIAPLPDYWNELDWSKRPH